MLQRGDRLLDLYRLKEDPIRSGPLLVAAIEPTRESRAHRRGEGEEGAQLTAWLWPESRRVTPGLWDERTRLVHRNIAPLLAYGHEKGMGVAVEKVARGAPLLQHVLRNGPLEEEAASEVLAQVARALSAANARGLWHGHLVADRIWLLEGEDALRWPALVHGVGLLPYTAPSGAGSCEEYDLAAFVSLSVLLTCGVRRWKQWREAGRVEPPRSMPMGLRDVVRAALDPTRGSAVRDAASLARALSAVRYPSAGAEDVAAEGDASSGETPEPSTSKAFKSIVHKGALTEAVIEEVKGPDVDESGQRYIGFVLRVRDEHGRWVRAKSAFWERANPDLFHSLRWAWAGAELSLFDPVRRLHRDESRSYTGWGGTVAVLEPYWPITVTQVHTAYGCPTRVLVDMRHNEPPNQYLVLGNIVHRMLEEIVREPEASFDTLYGRLEPSQRLAMLGAGFDAHDASVMREKVAEHYLSLRRFRETVGAPSRGLMTEISRYSGVYGIEGRIDLALAGEDGFHIMELKTGKVREEHLEQVRCYGLLWHGLADARDQKISGRILYSKDGSVRPVDINDIEQQRRILRFRNDLVALHRALADPSFEYEMPYFRKPGHGHQCYSNACHFRRRTCQLQGEVFGERPNISAEQSGDGGVWLDVPAPIVRRAWAYYRHLVRLIEAEYWVKNAEMGRILRSDALSERVEQSRAVAGLRLAEARPPQRQVVLVGEHRMLLQKGDEVIAHRGNLATDDIMCGSIEEVTRDSIVLSTDAAEAASRFEVSGWVVDKKPFRSGLRTAHRALTGFMLSRDLGRLELLLTPAEQPPQISPDDPALLDALEGPGSALLSQLNETQRHAAGLALCELPAVLVQGPPGTGKTHVIAALIKALAARGQRVLIAAQTNTAVDNVLRALAKDGGGSPAFTNFMRIGSMERASSDLLDALRRAGADASRCFIDTLAEDCADLEALREACLRVPVVATTTHRSVTHPFFHILGHHKFKDAAKKPPLSVYGPLFDVAIVDEAGQLNEPMTLAAINHARRFVLVGDHKQLPPIVAEEVSAKVRPEQWLEDTEVDDIGLRGLDRSLFERLIERAPLVMLERQYRMHASIMAISSRLFYEDRLRADVSCATRELELHPAQLDALPAGVAPALDPAHPVVFVDCDGQDLGRSNPDESAVVQALLAGLLEGPMPLPPHQVGVISPFRSQVHLLRADIAARFDAEIATRVDVDTVDRFQGGERDVIIVSLVKTRDVSEFLTDLRRLNVTMTRARSKLVVVGAGRNVLQHPIYRALLTQPEVLHLRWEADRRALVDAAS